jgi:hypothetical protein
MKTVLQFFVLLCYMSCGKKNIENTISEPPPLKFEIAFNSEDEIEIHMKSLTTTETLVLSDPSYYPITFLRAFDKKGIELPISKIKQQLNLKTAVIQLMPGDKQTFVFKTKLNVLFPTYSREKVAEIVAEYHCYAYKNKKNIIVGSLKPQ